MTLQQQLLDGLLALREGTKASALAWLRQPPDAPNAKEAAEVFLGGSTHLYPKKG